MISGSYNLPFPLEASREWQNREFCNDPTRNMTIADNAAFGRGSRRHFVVGASLRLRRIVV
jgi:hypothetical protein